MTAEIFIFSLFEVIFNYKSSSFEVHLHWNLIWLWYSPMNLCLKFEETPIIRCSDTQIFMFWGHLPLEVIFLWRSSSLKPYLTLVWSHELMFNIWGRSDQWQLKYSYFHFLRSYSIRSHLPLKFVFIETLFDFGMLPWTPA